MCPELKQCLGTVTGKLWDKSQIPHSFLSYEVISFTKIQRTLHFNTLHIRIGTHRSLTEENRCWNVNHGALEVHPSQWSLEKLRSLHGEGISCMYINKAPVFSTADTSSVDDRCTYTSLNAMYSNSDLNSADPYIVPTRPPMNKNSRHEGIQKF